MANYKYKGFSYTQEEIDDEVIETGLSLDEFLISNWANQTPARAKDITHMIRSGDY